MTGLTTLYHERDRCKQLISDMNAAIESPAAWWFFEDEQIPASEFELLRTAAEQALQLVEDEIRRAEAKNAEVADRVAETAEAVIESGSASDVRATRADIEMFANGQWRTVISDAASNAGPCPVCKGTGRYVGLTVDEPCGTCGGSGHAALS